MADEVRLVPRRFALRLDPPTLVLEYARVPVAASPASPARPFSGGPESPPRSPGKRRMKLYHHRIRLKSLEPTADAAKVARTLRKRFPGTLAHDVPVEQVERLVQRLIDHIRGGGDASTTASATDPTAAAAPQGGLSSLGGLPPVGGPGVKRGSGGLLGVLRGARLDDDDDDALGRLAGISRGPTSRAAAARADDADDGGDGGDEDDGGDESTDVRPVTADSDAAYLEEIAGIGDLQTATPVAVQMAKAKMAVAFEANRLKPGDEGYVHDKQQDFEAPEEPSGWDDSESD